jgi:hypothetical protein
MTGGAMTRKVLAGDGRRMDRRRELTRTSD